MFTTAAVGAGVTLYPSLPDQKSAEPACVQPVLSMPSSGPALTTPGQTNRDLKAAVHEADFVPDI
jgi:hypothetical protein